MACNHRRIRVIVDGKTYEFRCISEACTTLKKKWKKNSYASVSVFCSNNLIKDLFGGYE